MGREVRERTKARLVTRSGTCDAKCTATVMGGSVKCSGKCDAKVTPLECKGGKLEVMCNVDANCKANCDASVSAKAECTPPVMKVTLSGNIDAKLDQLRATLEKNLPVIAVAFKARTMAFATLIQTTATAAFRSAKIDASNLKAVSCGMIIGSNRRGGSASHGDDRRLGTGGWLSRHVMRESTI